MEALRDRVSPSPRYIQVRFTTGAGFLWDDGPVHSAGIDKQRRLAIMTTQINTPLMAGEILSLAHRP